MKLFHEQTKIGRISANQIISLKFSELKACGKPQTLTNQSSTKKLEKDAKNRLNNTLMEID